MAKVHATIDLVEGQFRHLVVEKREPRAALTTLTHFRQF